MSKESLTLPQYDTIVTEWVAPHIVLVTLNRLAVHHALNTIMMKELLALWRQLYYAPSVRCVIVTGAGKRAFCAGADLKERNGMTMLDWQKQHAVLEQMIMALKACRMPIIAAVNGLAYGGGLELLLACDFCYAAEHATFCQSEVKLGIMPGAVATQHMPRACGIRRAKELAFSGNVFSAKEAQAWGIINQVCVPDHLLSSVLNVAGQIAKNAPLAVAAVKRAMNVSQDCAIPTGYVCELSAYERVVDTEDRVEGICAFNEKRSPEFKGQ